MKKIPLREARVQHVTWSDCDVIIVNYNTGPLLADCVRSLAFQLCETIIVVDNASVDGSLDRLDQSLGDRLKIIRNSQNLGFAAACNAGIHASSSTGHLLFLNPDCLLNEDALQRMREVLAESDDIGMVGGFLLNPDGSEQRGGRRLFPSPARAFVNAFGLSRLSRIFPKMFSDHLLNKHPIPKEPAEIEAISGACMLVKREAIDDVGLWDEGYFLHCEDLDWCMRFRQKGWKIMFVPDAKVVHYKGTCSKSRPIFVEWHKHKGMVRFYRKFFRHRYPGVLMWLVVVGVWLRFSIIATYYGVRLLGRQLGIGRG